MPDYLNLADWAARLAPDGSIPVIVEYMKKVNKILDDMPWVEGNLPTGHRTVIRTGLPDVAWRLLNYGVQPSKSTTKAVTDTTGLLEAWSRIDQKLAELGGNVKKFRFSEDTAFMMSMGKELANTIFYGDTSTDPEKFLGLAPRYSSLSAPNASNIIDAGGSSNLTSIWLCVWGPSTLFGFFPQGSTAGLKHEDLGLETASDSAGGLYRVYTSHFTWDAGLCLKDWRYVCRIANIDVTGLKKDASSGADLIDLMVQAAETVEDLEVGTPAFYCNRTISSFLHRQALNAKNVQLRFDEVAGKPVLKFMGIPIRRVDALKETEGQVS